MNGLALRLIEDAEGFASAWAESAADIDVSPFLSATWVLARLETAPDGSAPFGVFNGERPLGLVFARRGRGGAVRLHLHETGVPEADAVYAEDVDFLAGPNDALRTAIFDLLIERKPVALVARTLSKRCYSVLVERAQQSAYAARKTDEKTAYAVDLDALRASGADFASTLSAGARRQSRRAEELLGAVRFNRADTVERRRAYSDALEALHAVRWKRKGRDGAFANPAFRRFHEALRRACDEKPDWGLDYSFDVLVAEEEIVGVLYQLHWRGGVYNYQTGFRVFDDNRVKPGLVAHRLAAECAREEGAARYDLLAGGGVYKERLAAPHRMVVSTVFERRGPLQWARAVARAAKNALRRR
ncbi:MAG: GNAT family N-acetyltransferase [Pseudomonadota bacterium]